MFFEFIGDDFFIEISHSQKFKTGEVVGGDTFITRRVGADGHFVMVLSDGLGSGIRANVLSTLTASMAVNYIERNRPLTESLRTILETLPKDDAEKISYATCSILEIDNMGEAVIVEFENPEFILMRGDRHVEHRNKKLKIQTRQGEREIFLSKLMLFKDDRLIFLSDGVTQSGLGSPGMPMGWERSGVIEFIQAYILGNPEVSARDLSKIVMQRAIQNDLFSAKDDITCGVIYLRAPRRLLLCTGPPLDRSMDCEMASVFNNYQGKKIICGGTTAQILSRELQRKITGDGRHFVKSNLPATAKMDGAQLVTEGILTLGHLADLIQNYQEGQNIEDSPAGSIMKLILDSDVIDILMGTKINEAHYDPNMPVEMEIRRNLVRRLKLLLEQGDLLKRVNLKFI